MIRENCEAYMHVLEIKVYWEQIGKEQPKIKKHNF